MRESSEGKAKRNATITVRYERASLGRAQRVDQNRATPTTRALARSHVYLAARWLLDRRRGNMGSSNEHRSNEDEFLLLVEDDVDFSRLVGRFLAGQGYRVVHARNGIEALELLHRGGVAPSLILVDLMMPRMGGLEFIERLDRDHSFRDVPVILMTGHARLRSAPRARFVDFLIKPFELNELIGIVRATRRASCCRWVVAQPVSTAEEVERRADGTDRPSRT